MTPTVALRVAKAVTWRLAVFFLAALVFCLMGASIGAIVEWVFA